MKNSCRDQAFFKLALSQRDGSVSNAHLDEWKCYRTRGRRVPKGLSLDLVWGPPVLYCPALQHMLTMCNCIRLLLSSSISRSHSTPASFRCDAVGAHPSAYRDKNDPSAILYILCIMTHAGPFNKAMLYPQEQYARLIFSYRTFSRMWES